MINLKKMPQSLYSQKVIIVYDAVKTENLTNSVVDASTVNAFKARLAKFWSHQAVKFDFTAVLTGTGNRSEELKKL